MGPEWGTKAKKNQGLDCKVDESTTAAVLKSGTVDRNCSTAPLAEGNNVNTGGKSVMESSLREGNNIIVEPVDQNLNISTAPLTEGNSVKSGGNRVMESSLREGNTIEITGPLYMESKPDKDSNGTTPSKTWVEIPSWGNMKTIVGILW